MPSAPETRPLGVVLLSVVQLLVAASMLTVSYGMAHGEVHIRISGEVLGGLADRAPYLALLAILPAALSLGLFLMVNWARVVALLVCCLFLSGCFWAWFNLLTTEAKISTNLFNALLLQTVAYGWAVIYLLLPSVARAFREAY